MTMAGRGFRRWLTFGAIVLGVLAVGLDVTVLSVVAGFMIPSERQDFAAGAGRGSSATAVTQTTSPMTCVWQLSR